MAGFLIPLGIFRCQRKGLRLQTGLLIRFQRHTDYKICRIPSRPENAKNLCFTADLPCYRSA